MLKVLLVGFGNFGTHYYRELCKLENEKRLELLGVVRKQQTFNSIEIKHEFYTLNTIDNAIIQKADLVVIVTPADTHRELVDKFSAHSSVLLEKPVASSYDDIQSFTELGSRANRVYVAQIFRYHPINDWLVQSPFSDFGLLKNVKGVFVNSGEKNNSSCSNATLEMNHMIDLSFYLFDWPIAEQLSQSLEKNIEKNTCLIRQNDKVIKAEFFCGWDSNSKENKRYLELEFENSSVTLDYVNNIVSIKTIGEFKKHMVEPKNSLIREQILDTLESLSSRKGCKLNEVGDAIELFSSFTFFKKSKGASYKQKVAIVGGGIFGASTALELGRHYDVTLIEKNSDLLKAASYWNQWRHHSGFHYPLSHSTIKEIIDTKVEFENVFEEAIYRNIPSYFFVAAKAKEIPAERYLSTCDLYNLNYSHVACPNDVDPSSVCLSLLTDEGIYDIDKLRELIVNLLQKSKNINVLTNTIVNSVSLSSDNKKKVEYQYERESKKVDYFDFVVDCSNGMAKGIAEALKPKNDKIRFEIVELLELSLPSEQACYTVIDGPFVSLTGTGKKGRFLLSHRDHSVHSRKIADKGPSMEDIQKLSSNKENILKAGLEYFPCLEKAYDINSFFSVKSISPYESEVWERPTIIKDHGFGVLSVIGGKILTSVSNAKELSQIIDSYSL